MVETGLLAAMFFVLITVIASYLLKMELNKSGIAHENTEKTTLIALGMPPISSLKARYIIPGSVMPGIENLSTLGKVYLRVARAAFVMAVLSLVAGGMLELAGYA